MVLQFSGAIKWLEKWLNGATKWYTFTKLQYTLVPQP
jgi:hypothetical protein